VISLRDHTRAETFEIGNFESRALIIITDGEELQGDALIAAREAARKGLAIFTIGVGSLAGARVPAKSESGVKFARNDSDVRSFPA
jgi:Ca-activated chloride channel family protein